MTSENPDIDLGTSCNVILQEWAKFGLEGLIILALLVLIVWLVRSQQEERETWQGSIDDLQDSVKDLIAAVRHSEKDGGK